MSHFTSTGFASRFWQRLRRPSTLVLIGAGLLAADRLRWLPAAWTDATFIALCAGLTLTLGLARLLLRTRSSRRREVRVLALPLTPSSMIEPDTRRGLLLFFLFVLALLLVPALFA